jgi:hypothetical protein
MALFDVHVEMTYTGYHHTQDDRFIEGLGISSGAVGRNMHGRMLGMFSVDAVSHRQAVWKALDEITIAAEYTGLPTEPVTFTIMRRETTEQRSAVEELHHASCACDCPKKNTCGCDCHADANTMTYTSA